MDQLISIPNMKNAALSSQEVDLCPSENRETVFLALRTLANSTVLSLRS